MTPIITHPVMAQVLLNILTLTLYYQPQPVDVPAVDAASMIVTKPHVKFTSDLKAIMAVVVDINPYMAKNGKKGQMWKDIAEEVKKKGLCETHSETTIKKKVDMLLLYHEVCFLSAESYLTDCCLTQNPNNTTGKQIAQELGESGHITIAALLDRAMYLRDSANKVAEEQKDKTCKVHFILFVPVTYFNI
jgi:hypothetical protein